MKKSWRYLSIIAIVILMAAASLPMRHAAAAAGCSVAYSNLNDWGAGATINVVITNTGTTAISGWTLTWSFDGNQVINNLWNGDLHSIRQSRVGHQPGL